MASIQTLSDADRRVIARWAIACAERVLPLFHADADASRAIEDAVARTQAYGGGQGGTADAIAKRMVAVKAAGAATTPAGAAAARSIAQAAAVPHMAAHALGAAAYAIKAVSLANLAQPDLVSNEITWQLAELTEAERAVLRQLPALGASSSGPLGPGLLANGILGSTIREIQTRIA
ncbi:putative immunity protein [Nocardia camponoti]|uniref:putative immunity protein n=1 Tax=Nocardia camponoti TaxID=1616106 RepID=UPI001664EF59|nr:hypothetical protein [Nocardia camponoti]